MLIRCPKCRYRFDEPVAEGITEVHSVCPLCGTPFVVAVGQPAAEAQQHVEDTPSAPAAEQNDKPLTDYEKTLADIRTKTIPNIRRRERSGLGCIIAIALFLILMLYLCSGSADRAQSSSDNDPTDFLLSSQHPTDTVPRWIEGSWIGISQGDTTTLSIYGYNIALTRSGTIHSGIHRIVGDKMTFHFQPDTELVCRLQPEKEQIILMLAEGKVKMIKTDHFHEQQQQKALAEAEHQARISSRRSAITKTTYTTPTQKKVKKKKSRRRRYNKYHRRR